MTTPSPFKVGTGRSQKYDYATLSCFKIPALQSKQTGVNQSSCRYMAMKGSNIARRSDIDSSLTTRLGEVLQPWQNCMST